MPAAIRADRDIDWVNRARNAMVSIWGTTDSTNAVSTWLKERLLSSPSAPPVSTGMSNSQPWLTNSGML